jgi:chromosome segregation ATPase
VAQQVRTQAVQLADHLAARQVELDRREADLNARSAEFAANCDKARRWFSEREADLEQLRQRWIEEHQKAKAELSAARRQLDEEQRRDWAEIQEKRRVLQQRAEQLDHASGAIRQVHEEVARLHRETLQMRLANEELLTRVAPSMQADMHQRTLKEIRLKLSEEFRRASDELIRKRQELLAVGRDLSEQHRKMTQERDRLHRLAAHVAARGKH